MVREGVIDGVADARGDGVTVVSRDGTIIIFILMLIDIVLMLIDFIWINFVGFV